MPQEPDRRDEFLLRMYEQMFNDIKTPIQIVWQAVTVVVGAFALLSLVAKEILPLDIAAALLCVLTAWLCAHTFNAAYWYNRNLVIIANIERQFLAQKDLREVHYYFGEHRAVGRMETSLRVQCGLAVSIGALVILYHFTTRVVPGFGEPWSNFEWARTLPYIAMVMSIVWCWRIWRNRCDSYREFLKNSPGLPIDSEQIVYGVGHPTD